MFGFSLRHTMPKSFKYTMENDLTWLDIKSHVISASFDIDFMSQMESEKSFHFTIEMLNLTKYRISIRENTNL